MKIAFAIVWMFNMPVLGFRGSCTLTHIERERERRERERARERERKIWQERKIPKNDK
jgi:hypothetical protein